MVYDGCAVCRLKGLHGQQADHKRRFGKLRYAYYLYDDSFIQHAAYPYNVDVCYMGCPTNGAYVSTVFVSDLVTGENAAVSTDWFGITGH